MSALDALNKCVFIVQVKNLRSSVARAAIACFGDLFATMGSAMEKVNSYFYTNTMIHLVYNECNQMLGFFNRILRKL